MPLTHTTLRSIAAAALLALTTVASRAHASSVLPEARALFNQFKTDFERAYTTAEEEEHRFGVFVKNLALVEMYNSMDDGAEYKITQFMDLTEEEFRAGFTGYVSSGEDAPVEVEPASAKESNVTSIDWTTKGAVTPVKNQGQCGSCWAFSTTGNIEGQNFMKTGKLVSLSEQQLVDCDTKQDHGCQGGLPSNAYEYIIQSKGLDTETSYPYTGSDGSCHYQKSSVGATISNWTKISEDETVIAAELAKRGPLSIGINAGPMQFYGGGVACPWKVLCNPKGLDHGVLIVGFGTDGGKDYWKIKNSWGSMWGENGYYRICRGQGACGLNTDVTTALI